MEKIKVKVVMLPTNKKAEPGQINIRDYDNKFELIHYVTTGEGLNPYHLYFLSDEEIQVDDKYIYPALNSSNVWTYKGDKVLNSTDYFGAKKIVATTDSSLGLPEIPEEFIKQYVESNGIIDEVYLECDTLVNDQGKEEPFLWVTENKVIISKEPKEFWTRDEVVELFEKYIDLTKTLLYHWLSGNL